MAEAFTDAVPSRYRYMAGILDGLRAIGGQAPISDVYAWLIERGVAYPSDLSTLQTDGGTRFQKEVRWARKELFDSKLLHAPVRGTWALTEAGSATRLDPDAARRMVSSRAAERRRAKAGLEIAAPEQSAPSNMQTSARSAAEGPTTGPLPTDWSRLVTKASKGRTYTYLAQFGQRDVWKIGHAEDVAQRLKDINRHIPSEIIGEAWSIIATAEWPNPCRAYAAEQETLNALQSHRTIGERICGDIDLVFNKWLAINSLKPSM